MNNGMTMSTLDVTIIFIYVIAIIATATLISQPKFGSTRDSEDYFLAGKSLPWWAIGASLIAANISAEQVMGMSGAGYSIGIGIASYEWMSALTLIIVGKFFLPIFLEKKIYTMPQFLDQRYNGAVRSIMAVFWIGVYTLVNLTSVLWLGALALNTLTGLNVTASLLALAGFASLYSLYGGLKAVALTDIIQVAMLVAGGLLISYISLNALSEGAGAIAGFQKLMIVAPEKFDMILNKNNPNHQFLPGLSVLFGGLWIMNLSYWGCNQYIIQRALAAKNVQEAQRGVIFAAFLKLLVPVLVVLPGMAAAVLMPNLERADKAYPAMIALAPEGIRGLIFAALIAAIVSSLGSMMNSIATIFTIDLFRPFRPSATERTLVLTGRASALAALGAAVLAARPLLGDAEQAFQWLQEFTGFFTPGVVTLFLLGMFWKRTTAAAAFSAAVGSAVASLIFKIYLPQIPFMNRVGYVFAICIAIAVIVSMLQGAKVQEKAIHYEAISFKSGPGFNFASAIITFILIALYWVWW